MPNYNMRRKNYGSIYTKVYTGTKSVGIHFKPMEKDAALKLARMILQVVEDGKSIDVTAFIWRPTKEKKVQVTVTGL